MKSNPEKGGREKRKAGTLSIGTLMKTGFTPEIIEYVTANMAGYDVAMDRAWQQALPEVEACLRSSRTWRNMKAAAQSDRVEELKVLLPKFLRELGLKLPEGVLRSTRGRAGRPASKTTDLIYSFWVALDQPKPADLARAVYGKKFTTAVPAERERMADRCAACVRRRRRKSG